MANLRVYSRHDFSFLAYLGQGSYGLVCKAKDRKTGKIHAIKIMSLPKLENAKVNYKEEIAIQSMVHHPHVISLHGWFIDSAPSKKWGIYRDEVIGPNDKCVYIILDYAQEGDLFEYMRKIPMDEATILAIGKQLGSAIEHCHLVGVMHRDIKPENVLIDSIVNGIPQVKLSDFGISTTKAEAQDQSGTTYYMAPELIRGSKYTREVDLWSLGVLIYELSAQQLPFYGSSDDEVADQILRGEVDYSCISSDKIKGIVSILLSMEPTHRVLRRRTI